MTFPHIVLASSSPRRKEILQSFHVKLTVHPSAIDESFLWNKDNIELGTSHLALEKALEAKKSYPSHVIIGADTVVSLHDEVLGKPRDKEQARYFLKNLSGRTHKVISGCAIIKGSRNTCLTDTTYVTFYSLSDDQIEAYLRTNIWTDKAGGYAIQGGCGSLLVKSIHGCFFNVIGLPLGKMQEPLAEYGISLWNTLPNT